MGEDGSQDQEFAELLSFLQDSKAEVQRAAAEGVLAQTEDVDFIEYCRRNPRSAARPLLRLAEAAEAEAAAAAAKGGSSSSDKMSAEKTFNSIGAGVAALQALVNLSVVTSVQDELVSLNASKRVTDALRAGWLEGRSGQAHWYAMLLANMTTSKKGQEAICKDEGVLRFLMAAFVSKPRPPPRDGYDDPLLCLGKVVGNVCVLPEGRKIFASGDQGPQVLSTLFAEMSDRARRPDIINATKNLCLDKDYHKQIVATDVLIIMATFLYPWDKVDAEQKATLPQGVQEVLEKEGATLTADVAVRAAGAVSLMGLCRTEEGREYLRAGCTEELLRAWLQEETDDNIKESLESVVPAVKLTEEELAAEAERLKASND
eukprot:gb/GFBE01071020.1/.p1 GENE.gb/GFBE01071020.1/~~gb/GFBE01071020.1/.p1  ORF type:complete len:374 (+),score=96.95 gb/GFBE01071020.1/:1-1122(+)